MYINKGWKDIYLAHCILGFHILGFNQPWIENIGKKIPEISENPNLNLPCQQLFA